MKTINRLHKSTICSDFLYAIEKTNELLGDLNRKTKSDCFYFYKSLQIQKTTTQNNPILEDDE